MYQILICSITFLPPVLFRASDVASGACHLIFGLSFSDLNINMAVNQLKMSNCPLGRIRLIKINLERCGNEEFGKFT